MGLKVGVQIVFVHNGVYIRHLTSTLVVVLHLRPLRSTDRAGMEPR